MLFCTAPFALFFAAVFIVYWSLPRNDLRVALLVAASVYFYASWKRALTAIICGSTAMVTGPAEPEAGVPRLLFKVRTGGLRWIGRRLAVEWSMPSTRMGRLVHRCVRSVVSAVAAPWRRLRRWMGLGALGRANQLVAFYDLQVQPVTYDILWFLAAADARRRSLGLHSTFVVIVPGPHEGLRDEDPRYDAIVDTAARHWRLQHVVVAALGLLPASSGFTLLSDRAQAQAYRAAAEERVYPPRYEPSMPVPHAISDCLVIEAGGAAAGAPLRAAPQGLRYVDRWLERRARGRRVITVTLRSYAYGAARNSDLAAWMAFARSRDAARDYLVFLPDTEDGSPLPCSDAGAWDCWPEASWNLGLRTALYERAWLNLGVSSGPMAVCWLNARTRYLTFKLLTPSVPEASERYFVENGLPLYASLPFASPFQKWVWEDDSADVIAREFAAMSAQIEAAAPEVGHTP